MFYNGKLGKCLWCVVDIEHGKHLAEAIYNAGYRKIPENAVVLMGTKDIQQFEWSKMCNEMGIFKLIEKECAKTRKETAEKFAARLKEKQKPLDEYDEISIGSLFADIDEICKELEGEK